MRRRSKEEVRAAAAEMAEGVRKGEVEYPDKDGTHPVGEVKAFKDCHYVEDDRMGTVKQYGENCVVVEDEDGFPMSIINMKALGTKPVSDDPDPT